MEHGMVMRLWRGILVIASTILIVVICIFALPLIYPFLFAWLIAMMLNPLVNALQKHAHVPRWLGVTLTLSLFVIAMLTIAAAVVTRIVKEIITLSSTIQQYVDIWSDLFISILSKERIQSFIQMINSLYKDNPDIQNTILLNISKTAESLANTVSLWVSHFLNGIVTFLSSLPNIATIAVVVILSAFLISKDWQRWLSLLSRLIPAHIRKPLRTIWFDLQKALYGYISAQLIIITITAFIVIIGLLVLHVEYAVTIGLLIGLVDLLPYLGVGFAMVPWFIYEYASGNTSLAIGLSILYGTVLITRQILEPKVLATTVGLDPLVTLIAMFVGLKLFGMLGLIMGPASVVLLTAIHRANVFHDLRNYIMNGKR